MGDVLQELLACLDAWEADARVLGNVRAGDARERIRELIESEDKATRLAFGLDDAARRLAFKWGRASEPSDMDLSADDLRRDALGACSAELHALLRENGPRIVGEPTEGDGLDALARALYGREARPREWLGGSDARILHDAARAVEDLRHERAVYADRPEDRLYHAADRTWWQRDPESKRLVRSTPPIVPITDAPGDDDRRARLVEALVSWVADGERIAALSDHAFAARLESALEHLPFNGRESIVVESILARLDRANGGPCPMLDGEGDPAFRSERDKRCACGACDGLVVQHHVCAWSGCRERATHARPLCEGRGSFVDVYVCDEHFAALEREAATLAAPALGEVVEERAAPTTVLFHSGVKGATGAAGSEPDDDGGEP